jgi:hypothetical protein
MAIGEVKPRTVKRPDGTTYKIYQGEYRDRDGERRHVSDKNKHEAQDKLRRAINEVKEWTHAKRKPRTLGQVIEEYLKDREDAAYIRKDISPDAYMRDKYVLSKVPEKLRRMKIAEFKDAGLFEELIKRLRTDGHAIRTVRAVLGGLSGVFAFAMKAPRGYVARNVLKDFPIRTPKPPTRSGTRRKSQTPCYCSVRPGTASLAAAGMNCETQWPFRPSRCTPS